jgi:ParB family transcriptional regulator, chromosome partitioning protein
MGNKRPKPTSAFKDAEEAAIKLKSALESGENVSIIPLSLIYSPKTHDRQCFLDSEIVDLAQSIKTCGLLQPIVVRKVGDKFERLIGFKRLMATKMNNEDSIKAIVINNIDDKQAALITISENLFRSDPNAYDQTLAFLDYLSVSLNLQSDQIKKLLNKHKASTKLSEEEESTLSQLTLILETTLAIKLRTFIDKLRVLTINTILIEAIQTRKITYTIALAMNSIKDDVVLKRMLDEVLENGLSLIEIKKKIFDLKNETTGPGEVNETIKLLAPKYTKSINKLPEDKKNEVKKYLLKIEEIFNDGVK